MKHFFTKSVLLMAILWLSSSFSIAQSDVFTLDDFNPTSQGYLSYKVEKSSSGHSYSACICNDGTHLRFKYEKSNAKGFITTESSTVITDIQLDWDTNSTTSSSKSNSIIVYGKEKAYGTVDQLYSNSPGTQLCEIKMGDNSVHHLNLPRQFHYVGLRATKPSPVCYLKSFTLTWKDLNNIHFDKSSYDVHFGQPFIAPKLQGVKSEVTYSSSHPEIASVDAVTGVVSIHSIGSTDIIATSASTESIVGGEAKYTLNILSPSVFFDFQQPSLFGVEFTNNSNTATYEHSPFLKDVAVYFSAKQPYPSFTKNGQEVRLRVSGINNTLRVKVPKGLKMKAILYVDDVKKLTKQAADDEVVYTLISDYVDIRKLTVDYSGNYQLTVSEAGYATFAAQSNYIMPEGLQGGCATIVNGNEVKIDYIYQPGDVVPAGTALLLQGAPKTYELVMTSENAKQTDLENALCPAYTDERIQDAGYKYYIFSYGGEQADQLGFYFQKGCADGSYVENISNKAYLKLETAKSVNSLRLNEQSITGISFNSASVHKDEVYTLSGVRVHAPVQSLNKGFYIVNGKKVIIK